MRRFDLVEAAMVTLSLAGLAGAAVVADAGLAEFGPAGRYALLFAALRAVAVCGSIMLCAVTGGLVLADYVAERRRRVAAIRLWRS